MKRKSAFLGVCLMAGMLMISGCGAKEESIETSVADMAEEGEHTEIYRDILDGFYTLIVTGSEDTAAALEGGEGVLEAVRAMEGENALERIGYSITDISGDGIPELLVGAMEDNHSGKEIYAVYTCRKDIPSCTFSGWGRSGYTSMGDGRFFYQGSNGAMYAIFATYAISPDGTSLICEDYYFTYEKDESFSEIGFYHNTSGAWEKDVSEELDLSEEEFWQIQEDLAKQTKSVALTPFSAYGFTGSSMAELPVTVLFASDVEMDGLAWEEFLADREEAQEKIVFMTQSTVKDFQVLSLSLENVEENGRVTFSTEKLYALEELTPERPLLAGMTIHGTIPQYGISYVDSNGEKRNFAVEISGMDGSLILQEF